MKKLLNFTMNTLGVLFVFSMVFAVGAIEANNFLIGAGFAAFGIFSGVMIIYIMISLDNLNKNLYYKNQQLKKGLNYEKQPSILD